MAAGCKAEPMAAAPEKLRDISWDRWRERAVHHAASDRPVSPGLGSPSAHGTRIARAIFVRTRRSGRDLEGHIVHLLAAAVIVLNAVGNSLLRVGLASNAALSSLSPLAYLEAFGNPFVLLGVILLACWMILQLALLSWADLTYVLPVTSLSYVLIALIAVFGLHEPVSLAHWCGILLILAGVIIAGRTRPLTTGAEIES